jgi:acylphosphatase
MMNQARLHVYVSGRVQGVFFRSSTETVARQLGLTGWVRNLRDGRVEAVFEGERQVLGEMLAWCHEGPEGAVVNEVEEIWENHSGEFHGFDIRYG